METTGKLKATAIVLVLLGALSFSPDVRASLIPALEGGATTGPTDSAGVANLTWYFTGVTPPAPGSTIVGFSAGSTFLGTPVMHSYTSGATKNTPLDPSTNNTAIGSIGTVVAPGPSTPTIPEPTTLLLLGSGL